MSVDLVKAARLLGAGRIAVGTLLLVAPGLVARAWVGPAGAGPAGRVLGRAMGARDLALGAGLIASLGEGHASRAWLVAGIGADIADFAATLAAGSALPRSGRLAALVAAGSGTATGAWLARTVAGAEGTR